MFTPKTLKVRGFRGFKGQQEFHFDKPAVILFGANHSGKSSTLNAIEWCLFGDECSGVQTNIRERVGWKIPNRHMRLPDVMVELVLSGSDGEYTIKRCQAKAAKRARPGALELTLPDGEVLKGEDAGSRLTQLLRCSFRDFMSTVYQHQESIRGILTQVPKERNDAIDRLLALSEYRNLVSGMSAAAPARWLKTMTDRFGDFEGRVRAVLDDREKEVERKRGEAAEAGLAKNQLTSKTALATGQGVLKALKSFAAEAGIVVSALTVPEAWNGLHDFEKSVAREITRLRGEMPLAQEQTKLFSRQTAVNQLLTELGGLKERQKDITDNLSDLGREHGGQETVGKRLAETKNSLKEAKAKHQEADARSSLIREAIDYLEKAGAVELDGKCPVCEGGAPDLLRRLRSRAEEFLSKQIAAIQVQINSLQKREKELKTIAEQYTEANRKQEKLLEERGDSRRKTGELLDKNLTNRDDPAALLNGEAKRVGDRLKELTDAIEQKQTRLDDIAKSLDTVRTIREILEVEEKKVIAQKIQQTPEYLQLEAARDLAAAFVGDVEAVKDAVSRVAAEEARDKLAAAESAIDEFFRRLTKHPAVQQIKLRHKADAFGRNSYDVTDESNSDLLPILSQGDLNALALAIFLGLVSSSAKTGGFGFVMLDDPSQSLDASYKEQLVKVLDDVTRSKQVVLATMDGEFRELLRSRFTKDKTEYVFEAWTPQQGAHAKPG